MKTRKPVLVASASIAVVLALGFAFKDQLLQWAFSGIKARAKKVYHAELNVSAIRFSGYNNIRISDLSLQPENTDTLISIQDAELHLSITDLFKGRISFNEVKLSGVYITIHNTVERNNFNFFKNKNIQKSGDDSIAMVNYRDVVERTEKKILQALNIAFDIKDFRLSYTDSSRTENIYSPKIKYDLQHLSGLFVNRQIPDTFQISGTVLEKNKKYEFVAQHLGPKLFYVPFLDVEKGLKGCFQSVAGYVELDKVKGDQQVVFDISTKDFHINHWRLAKGDVVLPSAQLKGMVSISSETIELDSSSNLILNNARFKLFANYHHDSATTLSLAVNMPETVSDTFFHALPSNAFNTLRGISCSGSLAYNLQFQINTSQPDSLVFLSALTRKNFHINHYGEENFERVNAPFVYSACNGDQFVRLIEIGPRNPMFTPLEHISPLLVKCVLQSEDPSFMMHRGFLPESFRESIVQDYHEKRFARGGSTISMQFVKNVFLNRDKTVSRKAQEALIVYLIENLGLISKERMLEIYLNVIEWGPNVYGVGEAAKFYFNKQPSELDLQECLFLAAIIPNPKYFKYQFDKEGHVKSYMADFFKLLAGRMATRNLISDEELQKLVPDVKLTGPASQFVTPNDSLPPDEELPDME